MLSVLWTGQLIRLSGKVLRYLASVGFIKENGQDQFGANKITHILADPNMEGGAYHAYVGLIKYERCLLIDNSILASMSVVLQSRRSRTSSQK